MKPKLRVVVDEKLDLTFPPPTRKSPVLASVRGLDTYNSHPAIGLTADMLFAYYRQAERGVPIWQYDCFDDLVEVDGHLRGLIGGRIESISGCDLVIQPGAPDKASNLAAGELGDRILGLGGSVGIREFLEHQLTAPHFGIALTNIVWDFVEGVIAPVELKNAAHRRFCAPSTTRADEIKLIAGDTIRDLTDLEPGLWAVSRYRNRNPWAAGLLRTAGWWAMFKRWSVRDWQVFAEMFGLPLVIGYYEDGAGPVSREALEAAVKSIGEDGFAVLSNMTEIVIKDTVRSGDSSTVYPQIAALCEAQMSKLIAGATLTTDSGGAGSKGSYALGSVHESRQYNLARSDARRVEEMFQRDIGRVFCAWNGFDRAQPPKLKIQITRDSLERAQALEILGQMMELDEDQIREEFSLRTPAAGKGVRMPAAAPKSPSKPSPGATP